MEHDEMDKLFRNIINEDNFELNDLEKNSMKGIWNQIDVPERKNNFHFWKIAAAILFFLWGGTAWFFSNKINQEKQIFSQLQQNYDEVKNSLTSVQLQLDQANTIAQNENIKPFEQEEKNEMPLSHPIQKEVFEKIVFVHDTIFVNQNISPTQLIHVAKDTVFIEVPIKASFKMTEFENQLEAPKEKKSTQKIPSKIEFVFGKKPLKKPVQQNKSIIIKDIGIAKKTNKSNSSLITIPIKN